MDEYVLNEKYVEILLDDTFLRTIIIRAREGSIDNYHIDLIRQYEIPIPEIDPDVLYNPCEVLKIVYRLKDIKKDINWERDALGNLNIEAIRFLALLESISGKRNFNKLYCLVFNEMYIRKVIPICQTPLKFIEHNNICGKRANLSILEDYRGIPREIIKEIIDKVLST